MAQSYRAKADDTGNHRGAESIGGLGAADTPLSEAQARDRFEQVVMTQYGNTLHLPASDAVGEAVGSPVELCDPRRRTDNTRLLKPLAADPPGHFNICPRCLAAAAGTEPANPAVHVTVRTCRAIGHLSDSGWSNQQVAAAVGASTSTVSRHARGECGGSDEHAPAVYDTLNHV